MEKMPIVTAQEMARIEEWAISKGSSRQHFMLQAGRAVAAAALDVICKWDLSKKVQLLIWKGNKGGDAFVAAAELLQKGVSVRAMLLSPIEDCSEGCRYYAQEFQKKGGVIEPFSALETEGVIIDGLLGTGFSGQVEGVLKEAIASANASGLPIIAIDIPSGLNGTSGRIGGCAIEAHVTVTMGLPKIGLFLEQALNVVGELRVADFGLPQEAVEQAEAQAYYVNQETVAPFLPPVKRCRHKYQAGLVVGFAGSSGYMGAAKLASLSALRGGAGLVKWFYMQEGALETLDAPYEVIRAPYSEEGWKEAIQKAKAVFLGPGLGQSEGRKRDVSTILSHLALPVVLDADALYAGVSIPPHSICTPHRGEMLRLLNIARLEESELLVQSKAFADAKNVILILKGAPTWIFLPQEKSYLVAQGDPGMATAGSGDVLTGLLAALLAQGCSGREAALLGVYIHAYAGQMAAQEKTSYCLIATDLISFFPKAFKECIRMGYTETT